MAANKIVTAPEAVALIRDGDTVAVSGFVGIGTPDELIIALARALPRDGGALRIDADVCRGARRRQGARPQPARRRAARATRRRRALVAGAEARRARPRQQDRGLQPAAWLRLASLPRHCGGLPGTLSKVGLRTFVDPRLGGGKLNARTTEDLVELVELRGKPWLLYKTFPIQIALVRGTTADPAGNITMEREALLLDNLASAMAAKNSGGLVIAQVERIAAADSLDRRARSRSRACSSTASCVAAPENHLQTYGTPYNHAYSGRQKVPLDRVEPLTLDERKIVARRCAFELPPGGVVNLGIGMPEGVAAVAAEERVLKYLTLTAEPGIIGGMPQGGLDFGAALNPDAVIHQNQQFDFYDGGGLDLACLGMAQADGRGNVNVSRFGRKLAGAGGFINISQNAKKLLLAGTFTAGGLEIAVEDGRLRIVREGRMPKFLAEVEQITFSGDYAAETGQPVLYVTERCVFRRTPAGMELAEVAPGIDIERDILAHMGFAPIVDAPTPMDPRIFRPEVMGLEQALLGLSLAERISYDAERNTIFLNFEGFQVRTLADVDLVRREMERQCRAIGRKVALVVNYDGFTLDPAVSDAYFSMITYMESRYYASASRYTTSAFMRLKLGAGLSERDLKPHVFETPAEAHAFAAAHNAP